MVKKIFILSLTLFIISSLSKADDSLKNDLTKTQDIIVSQIQAFQNKNAELAYSFASPIIKLRFNNPQEFISMVKSFYEPVYNPKQYYFIDSKYFEGSIYHQLQIISQSNMSYLATYSLIKDENEWKISGCSVLPMLQESI
ncbi:DUF4864 domain-containing protein [Alphaproteobacteria bacterium]|nr:DUF4864 domain-containing protein [Alphaproteobacteria bacterium]